MDLEERIKCSKDLFIQRRKGNFLIIEPSQFKWAIFPEKYLPYFDILSEDIVVAEAIEKGLSKDMIEQFYDLGLIMTEGKYALQRDFQNENASQRLSLLILHTSNACNFRCTYCYPDASTGKAMPLEIAIAAIQKAAQPHDNNLTIEFHGGEPLLHYNFIKEVVHFSEGIKNENGSKKLYYSIQTNASLLDDEKIDFLMYHNFKIGISIDGPREYNNAHRIYADGGGTYENILQGIKQLQKKNARFSAIMVVSDISVVDTVYDFMIKTGIHSLKLNPYFNQGRALVTMPVQQLQEQYAYKMLHLVDTLVEHNLDPGKIKLSLGNVAIMLQNIITPMRNYMCMRNPCGAGTSMLGVDVDGSVYPCEEMNGKKNLIIGNVQNNTFEEIREFPLVALLRSRRTNQFHDCQRCEVRNVCEVSCANKSYNIAGHFFEKSALCAYYKIMFPELMWRVGENPEGMKTLLL